MTDAREPLRILVCAPIEPYPPWGGWAMVVYNDVLNLRARGHDVRLFAITHDRSADPGAMRDVCPAEYFYTPKPPRWRQLLGNVGRRLPYLITRYVCREMMDAARRLAASGQVDILLAEDVAMAEYGPALRAEFGVPYFVRAHNVDTQIVDRFLREQRSPVNRAIVRWQLGKVAAYERRILKDADGASMITDADADEIRRRFPELNPAVIGAGTDLERFTVSQSPRDPSLLMHVGSLTTFTKLKSMQWFAREVLPQVRNEYADACLELVGAVPDGAFDVFEGVNVIGRVPDERPALARGRVFVAPQFVGSGVRLKILNALATANAVVCTPVACEGIPLVHREHAMICEDSDSFAKAVLALLRDDGLRDRLASNGRKLVEENYDWRGIVGQLEGLLYQAIERRRGRSTPTAAEAARR